MAILGVDVGGTFTDAVLLADGELHTAKVPTRPAQEASVLEAARWRLRSSTWIAFIGST
jgi:N-methylhydantoinase A